MRVVFKESFCAAPTYWSWAGKLPFVTFGQCQKCKGKEQHETPSLRWSLRYASIALRLLCDHSVCHRLRTTACGVNPRCIEVTIDTYIHRIKVSLSGWCRCSETNHQVLRLSEVLSISLCGEFNRRFASFSMQKGDYLPRFAV